MVLPFNLESAVDIGFVALVAYTCYRSMFRAQDPVVNTTSQWKDELTSLEGMLRELIGEASAASNNLNRSLIKRKEELDHIVVQIESARRAGEAVLEQSRTISTQRQRTVPTQQVQAEPIVETLPNPTWERPAPKAEPVVRSMTSAYEQLLKAAASRPPSTQSIYESNSSPLPPARETAKPNVVEPEIVELETLIDQSQDRVSLSQSTQHLQPRQPIAAASLLAAKIEKITEQRQSKPVSYNNLSVDPVTMKIARRLLESGKEIHVVARKLDLPVAEIREIERSIRLERGESAESLFDENRGENSSMQQSFERSSALV